MGNSAPADQIIDPVSGLYLLGLDSSRSTSALFLIAVLGGEATPAFSTLKMYQFNVSGRPLLGRMCEA